MFNFQTEPNPTRRTSSSSPTAAEVPAMTEKHWWKVLRGKSPKNPAWLAFADWLEGQGEDGRAYGARMVFERGLKPHQSFDTRKNEGESFWDWWRKLDSNETSSIPDLTSIPDSAWLDNTVFDHLTDCSPKTIDTWNEYTTREEAYKNLLNAYAKLYREKHHDGR